MNEITKKGDKRITIELRIPKTKFHLWNDLTLSPLIFLIFLK